MKLKPYTDINQLVLNHTKLRDGYSSVYLSLHDFMCLLDRIIEMEQTTEQLSITPFYLNEKLDFHEEFDFGGFYIECRDSVSDEEANKFWLENKFWGWSGTEYNLLDNYVTNEDLKRSNFLVQNGDVDSFRRAILIYKEFLMERGIPQMMKWLYELCDLKDEDLPYGYFCFEVNCN